MAVSKRVRYEILRRDSHSCRYCGAKAPDATLVVDHVVPVALGGSDESTNLVTACHDCNAGKSSTIPDGPLMADVDAKAAQWAEAMKIVAHGRAVERMERDQISEFLYDHWEATRPNDYASSDLPSDWEASIWSFMDAGLELGDLEELMSVALNARPVAEKWRYFCGCCWKRVRQSQEHAARIVALKEPAPERPKVEILGVAEYDVHDMWFLAATGWRLSGRGELPFCACSRKNEPYCGEPACMLMNIVIAAREFGADGREPDEPDDDEAGDG